MKTPPSIIHSHIEALYKEGLLTDDEYQEIMKRFAIARVVKEDG